MIFYESHWFGNKNAYQAYCLENFSIPCHFHRSYEIISINRGHISLTVEDKTYQMAKNDIAFIFPNQLHSYVSSEDSVLTFIIFSPELIGSFSTQYQNKLPCNNVISYAPLYAANLQFKDIYQRKSFLYGICSVFINHTDFFERKTKNDRFYLIHKVLTYIDEHIEENCNLVHISKELGYDCAYISKFFHDCIGMTYTSYLNQYRITHACYMLRNTKEKISTISTKCGYDNQHTFDRNFKKITGLTPAKYRHSDNQNL